MRTRFVTPFPSFGREQRGANWWAFVYIYLRYAPGSGTVSSSDHEETTTHPGRTSHTIRGLHRHRHTHRHRHRHTQDAGSPAQPLPPGAASAIHTDTEPKAYSSLVRTINRRKIRLVVVGLAMNHQYSRTYIPPLERSTPTS